jgi:hypothetical protein
MGSLAAADVDSAQARSRRIANRACYGLGKELFPGRVSFTQMPKKEGAKEKAANKAQAEADARAKAAEDAMWADDDRGKAKKDGKKVRAVSRLTRIARMLDRMFVFVTGCFVWFRRDFSTVLNFIINLSKCFVV